MLLLTYTLHVCYQQHRGVTFGQHCCAGVEQPPPVQQPPPQPLQQQPQKPEPLLINGQETVKAAFASQQMIGGVAPGAKTPPPVVSSAVAAWIAATPTIAPVSGIDYSARAVSRLQMQIKAASYPSFASLKFRSAIVSVGAAS